MAGKPKPLSVRLFLIRDGKAEQIDRIPVDVCQIMTERIRRRMSEYYSQHPDEYMKLLKADT